ncbi:MAG: hypothetical protein K6F50_09620 [Kiritimatiellae bacterium]|nr:hypothetical protein [Kiritimatiellia bacterium]
MPRIEIGARAAGRAAVNISAKAAASEIVRMDCRAQAEAVAELLAGGIVADGAFPEDGELDEVESAAEKDYDCECEYIDDDDIAPEENLDGWNASRDIREEEASSPFVSDKYRIVVEKNNNGYRCIAPDDPYSALVAKSASASNILSGLHNQFAFYRAVAAWLETEAEEKCRMLSGVKAFRDHHVTMTCKDFCEEWGGFAPTSATYYIANCLLALPDGSIPLGSIFRPAG